MIYEEDIEERLEVLYSMLEYGRKISDEEIKQSWLVWGIPLDSSEDSLRNIAEDDEEYLYTVSCFFKVLNENERKRH